MSMTPTSFPHLEHRRGSNYRQLSIKGRRIRAATVWEYVHGPDHYTPEEFARDFDVPIEAVREALDYVEQNMPLIEEEREMEKATFRGMGIDLDAPPIGRDGWD